MQAKGGFCLLCLEHLHQDAVRYGFLVLLRLAATVTGIRMYSEAPKCRHFWVQAKVS